MKKILSVVLVLCMLCMACFFFTSCDKVSLSDVKKDPYTALNSALSNATEGFFTDDAGVGKVLQKTQDAGAFSVMVESDTLMGDITKISETVYVDFKNSGIVSDTLLTYGGEDLTAKIYANSTGLAVNSEAILGSTKTLLLNFADVAQKLETSAFASLLGNDPEAVESIKSMIASIESAFTTTEEDTDTKEALDKLNAYLELFGQTITEETVNGENCVSISYTVNNANLKALIAQLKTENPDMFASLEASLGEDTSIEGELDSTFDLNLTFKLSISKAENAVTYMGLNGTVTEKGFEDESSTATVSAELSLSDTEIKCSLDVSGIDDPVRAEVVLTKTENSSAVTYALAVSATLDSDSITVNLLNASYTYTKSSGAVAISLDIYNGEGRTAITLDGSITVTSDTATFAITKIVAAGEEIDLKLTLSAKAVGSIPAVPSDAKNILDLSESDWMEIMTELQNSKLMELIYGSYEDPYYDNNSSSGIGW